MTNMEPGSAFCKLQAHKKEVSCCAFNKDYFITSSGDKSIRIYSATDFTEKSFSPLLVNKYGVNYVTFDPKGELLASASTDGTAHLWSIDETGAKIVCVFRHPDSTTVQVCDFSRNSNMLVTGCSDGGITVWSIEKKKKLFQILGHPEGNVNAVSFTPCNNYLVTGSAVGDLRVWDLRYKTEFCIMQTQAHDKGVSGYGIDCICFSPTFHALGDGEIGENYLMASCGQDNQIKLWLFKRLIASVAAKKKDASGKPIRCLQPLHELSGHHGPVSQCCFSPDGTRMASSSFDKTIIIWNLITSEQISVLEGHSAIVTCVRFSLNSHFLASTSYDKTSIIWRLTNDVHTLKNNEIANDVPQAAKYDDVKKVDDWTTRDVVDWLEKELELTQYSKSFSENEIDGAELLDLTADSLSQHLGVAPLGHRNKIIRGIKSLQSRDSLLVATEQSSQNGTASFVPSIGNIPLSSFPVVGPDNIRRTRPVGDDSDTPDEYLCPISREIMMDPVIAADGFSYERSAIELWFQGGSSVSPMTNKKLATRNLLPNQALKGLIMLFIENKT